MNLQALLLACAEVTGTVSLTAIGVALWLALQYGVYAFDGLLVRHLLDRGGRWRRAAGLVLGFGAGLVFAALPVVLWRKADPALALAGLALLGLSAARAARLREDKPYVSARYVLPNAIALWLIVTQGLASHLAGTARHSAWPVACPGWASPPSPAAGTSVLALATDCRGRS